MDSTLAIQKPRGRGRFCHRDIWDQIHQDRFGRWLEGDTIQAIAQAHGVTQRAVHLSVAKMMAGLHRERRIEALQYRYQNRFGFEWKLADMALVEYQALMDPSWLFAQIQRIIRRAARTRRSRKR